jgi:hypothetical protein
MYQQFILCIVIYCHFIYNIVIGIVQNCHVSVFKLEITRVMISYLKNMIEDRLLSSANISAVLLGMDGHGAMDNVPLFFVLLWYASVEGLLPLQQEADACFLDFVRGFRQNLYSVA